MKCGVNLKVCFLLTHVPNPRINKRIEVIKSIAETHVICTRRASQNIWEPAQDVEHIIFDIDLPGVNQLAKRYIVSRDFQKKAFAKLNELKPDIIYAEGLDTLIIAGKYKKNHNVRVIFEVADLRESFIETPKNAVKKAITKTLLRKEKKVFKNVDYLVITSPKFYDVHYKSLISKDRVIFMPNSPDKSVFKSYQKKRGGEFTVGFIGGIRYLRQMKMLVDSAGKAKCNVLFAGAGGTSDEYKEITAYCKGKSNIRFTGRYDYNTQIADLYGMVDCVFSVYDADNPNVRIALPNKLYESVLCQLPLIVAKGTYLEELVNEWGVGVGVDHRDSAELIEAIDRLKNDPEYYKQIENNCLLHAEESDLAVYNQKLANTIKTIIK